MGDTIYDVDISADGSYIVACGGDDNLYLFHRNSSIPIWNLTVGEYSFLTCAISDDGYWIVAGHYNGNVYMFNRTSSRPMWVYHFLSEVYYTDMSADGSLFVVQYGYTGLTLFNRSIPIPIKGFSTVANINDFDLSENGKWLAVTDWNDRLRLYNTSESQPVWQNLELVEYASISADGQYIVAGASEVYFYDRTNSTPIWSYNTALNTYKVKISADGTSFAVGTGASVGTDGVFYFNSNNSEPLWFSPAGVSLTRCMAISSNGMYVAVGDGENIGVGQIILFYQDKISPTWDTIPTNQIIEFGTDFSYDVNASDSSGISYYWINDTINFNITTNGLITNISSLNIGDYLLEIRAYDPDDNYCTSIINISVVDTIAPHWDLEPSDQIIEFGSYFSYDVNASDLSGIEYYWINDTINFNINANGLIINASYLNAGIYWVEVRSYDPFDNYCSAIINITVVDSTPPLWDTNPVNQINEFRSSFSYDVDASDLSGIAYYWINDTINFNINANGLITNASSLNVAEYWIEIRAYNPSDYFCSAVINITVVDTTPPSWDSYPVDQLVELGNELYYDVDASDFSGIASYWINDTINFNIDANGLIVNANSLSTGDYWIEIRAYDPFDNYCSFIIKITVSSSVKPPQIPGYELIIMFNLIGIAIIGFIIYIWKQQKITFNSKL
ncbi:MAG: WD40 repeat domain-containing protein [Candidatus Odinarchaeota archaeon]